MKPHNLRTSVIASIIGNILEWYEFSLYVYFTPIFSKLFFPASDHVLGLLNTFLVFALGFLSRPIGALFFGHLGDKIGRKAVFVLTIFLTTIPTFLIGFLPTYAQIGIAAPILLALLRLLQGFPSGGEFSGVMCYLVEISPAKKIGLLSSFAFLGSQLGNVFSTVEFVLMKQLYSEEFLMSWGWRISFILGGTLGLIGCYFRNKLKETPAFEKIKKESLIAKRPILDSLLYHKKALMRGFFLSFLPLAGWYLLFVFTPIYLSTYIGMHYLTILLINAGMIVFSSILLPFLGRLGDLFPKKPMLIATAIATVCIAYPFYFMVNHYSLTLFILFEIIVIVLLSLHFALLPQLLCELFPTSLRYTGVAISYNFCGLFFGGTAPFFALYVVEKMGTLESPGYLLMISALVTLVTLFTFPKETTLEKT